MKRILFLIAIVSLLFLSACSGDKKDDSSAAASTTTIPCLKDSPKELLCKRTDGNWIDINKTCRCECNYTIEDGFWKKGNLFFIEDIGCTSEEDICAMYDGTWIAQRKAILQRSTPNQCRLIPNSAWSKEDDACLIFNDNVGTYLKPPKCLINGTEAYITGYYEKIQVR